MIDFARIASRFGIGKPKADIGPAPLGLDMPTKYWSWFSPTDAVSCSALGWAYAIDDEGTWILCYPDRETAWADFLDTDAWVPELRCDDDELRAATLPELLAAARSIGYLGVTILHREGDYETVPA